MMTQFHDAAKPFNVKGNKHTENVSYKIFEIKFLSCKVRVLRRSCDVTGTNVTF